MIDGGPKASVEVERKYRVHGLFRLPPFDLPKGHRLGAPRSMALAAVYFDTPDLRLARSRVTLRRRTGGADEGWHLKLPLGGEAREELVLPLAAGQESPPEELADLVLALARSCPLEAVATLRTERNEYPVIDSNDTDVASLTDDSVSVLDGDRAVARFRELEIELSGALSPSAGPDLLDEIGAVLVSAGAVPGGTLSKVGRALGPLASAPADVEIPGRVRRNDPARMGVAAHVALNTRALLRNDVAVRRDLEDSVHQMRVAARRLRSGLKVFGPLLEADRTTPLRGELAWLAAVLGEARDGEVLRDRLLNDLDELLADQALQVDVTSTKRLVRGSFAKDMSGARTRVLAALKSDRYLALLDSLVLICRELPTTEAAEQSCEQMLPPLVDHAWRRLARDVNKLEIDGPDHDWHRTRISAKRARYACEAVVPVFGKPARRLAEQVELVTELLGEHQDAALAAATVRRLADRPRIAGPTGFVLGLLHGTERAAVQETRIAFVEAWPEISRHHWRRWLGHPR